MSRPKKKDASSYRSIKLEDAVYQRLQTLRTTLLAKGTDTLPKTLRGDALDALATGGSLSLSAVVDLAVANLQKALP